MSNQRTASPQSPSESNDIIDYWLSLRQQLIIDFGKVAGLSKQDKHSLPTADELHHFCETLVDYISAGHFKIYNMVMDRWRDNGFSGNAQIDAVYAGIVQTTEPLVAFSDKYSHANLDEDDFEPVDQDILKLRDHGNSL